MSVVNTYVPVNGYSRKVKKAYVSISNQRRRIKRIYVSVHDSGTGRDYSHLAYVDPVITNVVWTNIAGTLTEVDLRGLIDYIAANVPGNIGNHHVAHVSARLVLATLACSFTIDNDTTSYTLSNYNSYFNVKVTSGRMGSLAFDVEF